MNTVPKFEKGNPGRPVGATNRLAKTVKGTVLEVFNKIQEDPKLNLVAFSKKYPREFYQIAARLIPTELQATIETYPSIKIEMPEGMSINFPSNLTGELDPDERATDGSGSLPGDIEDAIVLGEPDGEGENSN
jgi:hypothetical protein